jgi:hypothetical protein
MRSPDSLSVTLLGPDIDQKKSLEAMLTGRVSKLTWLPDSITMQGDQPMTLAQRVRRSLDQLTSTHDKTFVERACRHLEENSTDIVIGYWGTMPLADLAAIKRLKPNVKTVLLLLCFPLALDNVGVKRQYWKMRHAARSLDAIVFSSKAMQAYFHDDVLGKRGKNIAEVILKPCWPRSYQCAARQGRELLDRPNLIFVGRTDLSSRTIHAADNLQSLMAEILENKIELHHARSPETTDGHPYRRPFDALDQGELIAKMAEHDASLIVYNAAACQRTERLEFTVPDRLLTSVAAGVPIAIPSVGYTGPKQYLADYPAVLQYDSVPHLKQQLADRERMQVLHQAAWKARDLYTAEAQGHILAQFLASL